MYSYRFAPEHAPAYSERPESVGNFSDVLSLPSAQTVWNRPPFLPAPCAASAKTAPDSAKSSAVRRRAHPPEVLPARSREY